MQVHRSIQNLPVFKNAVVTIGTFDGVHLAHRAVLDETVRRAAAARQQSVLVTFEPHPLEVGRPERAPALLTTPVERCAALAETGIGHVLVLRFDAALAALPPERFVREILRDRVQMRELVIGYDHGLGRGRSGDVEVVAIVGYLEGIGRAERE